MQSYIPTADDFAPLDHAREGDRIDRPSLSYWQDVWRRLQHNSRALASLYIVIALLLFTLVSGEGPDPGRAGNGFAVEAIGNHQRVAAQVGPL